MPNTLQFQASGDHQLAHLDVGTARQARALFLDRYLDIKAEIGEAAAQRTFKALSDDLDKAVERHALFHPREVA